MSALLLLCAPAAYSQIPSFTRVEDAVAADPGDPCGSEDCFYVASEAFDQQGAVWSDTELDLRYPFEICVRLHFGFLDNGGEGMAFVLQTQGTGAIGGLGGSLGFGAPIAGNPNDQGNLISPSLAIEFDTRDNGANDPAHDHIALIRNGDLNNPELETQAHATQTDIEDDECHDVCISWDPRNNNQLTVTFDGSVRISTQLNIPDDIFSGGTDVTWGFTSSTSDAFGLHTLCVESVSNDPVCCESECPNEILNNTFSGSCQESYGTDLTHIGCTPAWVLEGQVMEGTDASQWNQWWEGTDHTGDGGRFLMVNGPTAAAGDAVVWRQNVDVKAGKEYCFSAWVKELCNGCAPGERPVVELRADNTVLLISDPIAFADGWELLCTTFTANFTGSIPLEIVVHGNGTGGGNDVGIDDLVFQALECNCCEDFEFTFGGNPCSGNASAEFVGDDEFCDNPVPFLIGMDAIQFGNPTLGAYSLMPGEMRTLVAGLVNDQNETICSTEVVVSCPVFAVCCDGLLPDATEQVANPGTYNLTLTQNQNIPCNVYAVKVDGTITADGYGSPLTIPAIGNPGLAIGSVNAGISSSPQVEYLDISYQTICSQTLNLSGSGVVYRTEVRPDTPITETQTDSEISSIQLMPNPGDEQVFLSFVLDKSAVVTVEVVSATGQETRFRQVKGMLAGPNRLELPTAQLANGLYFVRVITGNSVQTNRIVIQH